MLVRVSKRFKPPEQVMRDLGVDERGRVQQFATDRILFHMRKFMPWREGKLAPSLTQATSPTTITVNAPYARYLYEGQAMRAPGNQGPFPVGNGEFRYRKGAHPVPTGKPLNYTKTTNPLAGPHWDRTLMQYEGAAIAEEVEMYARSKIR